MIVPNLSPVPAFIWMILIAQRGPRDAQPSKMKSRFAGSPGRLVHEHHGQREPEPDRAFHGALLNTRIAVDTLVGIGDLRHLLLFGAKEDILGTYVDTQTTF